MWVQSWAEEITWRREGQSTPVFLPGESHGQRDLVGYTVQRVAKSQTQLKQLSTHTCGEIKEFESVVEIWDSKMRRLGVHCG